MLLNMILEISFTDIFLILITEPKLCEHCRNWALVKKKSILPTVDRVELIEKRMPWQMSSVCHNQTKLSTLSTVVGK